MEQRPHIGITGEWIGTQAGGLETYSRSLIAEMGRQDRFTLSAYTTRADALPDLPGVTPRYLGTQSRAVFHGAALPLATLRDRPDLLHVTSIPPLWSRVPYVMTVHDLGHKVMPDMYPPRIRWRLDKTIGMGIRRARHIICVSTATRDDLLHYYRDLDPHRVHVVGEGGHLEARALDPAKDAEVRSTYGLPGRYFLYVGRLHVRKNLITLLDAFAALPPELRVSTPLVLVGRALYGRDEIGQRIAELGLGSEVRRLGHVPDAHLPALYRGATAFTYPSLFEGFGLPPLEAMTFGTPVITSDRHSLPEVVGDAGICVDATRPELLRDAMLRLGTDPDLRQDLIERGLARAARFTWQKAAAQTGDIYQLALDETARKRFVFSPSAAKIL